MLERNRTYTYDELEKIIKTASDKVLKNIDEQINTDDIMAKMMFQTQAMMVASLMAQILLKGENNGNN